MSPQEAALHVVNDVETKALSIVDQAKAVKVVAQNPRHTKK